MFSSRFHYATLFLLQGLLGSGDGQNVVCDSSVLITRDSSISSKEIICTPLGDETAAPALDGDLSEWTGIAKNRLALTSAHGMLPYASGDVEIMCTYDEDKIYMVSRQI